MKLEIIRIEDIKNGMFIVVINHIVSISNSNEDNYTEIHLTNGKKIITKEPQKDILNRLGLM